MYRGAMDATIVANANNNSEVYLMRFSLTPNHPRSLDETKAVFAAPDARWKNVPDEVESIDVLDRMQLDREALKTERS